MAVSLTARLGIHRWTEDSDPWSRQDFDDDNAALEELVAVATQGLAADRPAAGNGRQLYYSTDTDVLAYDTGTIWRPILLTPTGRTTLSPIAMAPGWAFESLTYYKVAALTHLEFTVTRTGADVTANTVGNISDVDVVAAGGLPTTLRPIAPANVFLRFTRASAALGDVALRPDGSVVITDAYPNSVISSGNTITVRDSYLAGV